MANLRGPDYVKTNSIAMASTAQSFDVQRAMSQATIGKNAVITMAYICFNVTLDTLLGQPGLAAMLYQLVSKLTFDDMKGNFCNISGMAWWALNKWEKGDMARDGDGFSAGSGPRLVPLRLPLHWLFPTFRVSNPEDYWIPAKRYKKKSQFLASFAQTVFGRTNSWNLAAGGQCWMEFDFRQNPWGNEDVQNDGVRVRVNETALSVGDSTGPFEVKGKLRLGAIFAGTAGCNANPAPGFDLGNATNVITVSTPELAQSVMPLEWMRRRGEQLQPLTQTRDGTTQVVTTESPFSSSILSPNPLAFALYESLPGEDVGAMPNLDNVNPNFTNFVYPAGSTWLTSIVEKHQDCTTRDGIVEHPRTEALAPLTSMPPAVRPFLPVLRKLPPNDPTEDC